MCCVCIPVLLHTLFLHWARPTLYKFVCMRLSFRSCMCSNWLERCRSVLLSYSFISYHLIATAVALYSLWVFFVFGCCHCHTLTMLFSSFAVPTRVEILFALLLLLMVLRILPAKYPRSLQSIWHVDFVLKNNLYVSWKM